MTPRFAAILFLLCALSVSADGQDGPADARNLAGELGLSYEEIGGGAIHSAKLSGKGHEVLIFAEMRNIVVDGETALVSQPVEWTGSGLSLSQEAADLIRERVGERPASVAESAAVVHRAGPFRVVLDPGHGGSPSPDKNKRYDPGAIGRTGLQEKDINLEVALRVGKLLESQGVKVIYTRRTDVYVELDDRAKIANRAQPDLFVSIHTNADERKNLRGATTLYPDDGPRDGRPGIMSRALEAASQVTAEFLGANGSLGRGALLPAVSAAFEGNRIRSIQAARTIENALAPVTGGFYRDDGVIEDSRGVRVLRNVHAPAVLVELDYLSNTYSERKLATSAYRASIADALGRAVMKFLEDSPQ